MPPSIRRLCMILLTAIFTLPTESKAQIVGSALPDGSAELYGPDEHPFVSQSGNPIKFDQSIDFNGLTATAQAGNGYGFSNTSQSVGFAGSLSVSGSIVGAYEATAFLSVGGGLSGWNLSPSLPDGVGYWYGVGNVSYVVVGTLAPGDTAIAETTVRFYLANGSTFGQNSDFYHVWNNTTSEMMNIAASVTFSGTTFGDWFSARNFGLYARSITADLDLWITKGNESSATSSISIDPTFSAVESITGAGVPEPSSLVLSGIAIL
jgi:hypothetical protein